jgi:histidinol-phosphatase (PHP family)
LFFLGKKQYFAGYNTFSMNLTNYHSHCSFCDGHAPLEEFIKVAIAQGFTSYGVSSHAPLPFSTHWTMNKEKVSDYLREFARLKEKYASQIELYVGMEIDYLNEESNPACMYFRELPLDYRIGSVHLLYDDKGEVVDIDCKPERFCAIIDEHFGGDIVRVVRLYYERLLRMVELGGFDILGHADKIHYNASVYRPDLMEEDWYGRLMHDYFSTIARKGYMVEINTKAYLQLGAFYPNERYFPLLKELGIRVLVNSDAHYPERINSGRTEALSVLKKVGYSTVMELHKGKWVEERIV